jgi:hypothetical protein
MNGLDDGVDIVTDTIYAIEDNVPDSERKRYRFPLLICLAKRLTAFSPGCDICRHLQGQIVSLCSDLVRDPPMTRRSFRNYLHVLKMITRHLKRGHGLAEKRQYTKRFLFFSLITGLFTVVIILVLLSFGITLFTLNITLPALFMRVVASYTTGLILDKRAVKHGKVF